MPDGAPGPNRRSGCAVFSGFFLVTLGVILLGFNLGGLSFLRRGAVVLDWLSVYWPLFLVIWGVSKIVQRLRAPERSRVSALEVIGLVFFVIVGLSLSAGRRALERLSHGDELDHVVELVGPELLGPRHEFVETESFPLESPAGRALLVESPRGGVRVIGTSEDRIQVRIVKRLHDLSETRAREIADGVSLELVTGDDDAGDRKVLRVNGTEGRRIETELTLQVPRSIAIEVRTRRGRIEVEDIEADVRLRTTDASIEATRVGGSLSARTDRGDIRLSEIRGSAEANASRGAIYARRIEGALEAKTSRAAVVAEDIAGSATLDNRHGSLRARRIGGDVTIDGYNADIAVESAASSVRIDANQGTVFVRDVGAGVTLNVRRAALQLSAIRGGLVIEGSDATTALSEIQGTIRVTARQSDVRGGDLEGSVAIEDAGDVEISRFTSDLRITSRHGDIRVETDVLQGDVTLESSYGDVELTLPREASARLEAKTEDGTLESNLPSFERDGSAEGFTEGERERRWVGLLGAGARGVTMISLHGDLRLTVREP